ncbi:hypothetical protein ABZX33_37960 [Streptomyces sp. NPDC004608]
MMRHTARSAYWTAALAGSLALAVLGPAPTAAADGPVYLGKVTKQLQSFAAVKTTVVDKQYRGVSLPDYRTHLISVKVSGACPKWRVRAAVERPGGGSPVTVTKSKSGCGTVHLTLSGGMRKAVSLSMYITGGGTFGVTIPPVR